MPHAPRHFRLISRAQAEKGWRSRSKDAGRQWYNTTRWRALRAQQLQAEPICAECWKNKVVTPATVADHAVPHAGNEDSFWNGKLASLCKSHHDKKSRQEQLEAGINVGN